MRDQTQEILIQQVLDEASLKISSITGKQSRVYYNHGSSNNLQRLKDAICDLYSVSWNDLRGNSRLHDLVIARQLFSWFGVMHFNYQKIYLGAHLNRDHTTVIHSINRVQDMITTKEHEYMAGISELKKRLSINQEIN